MKYTIAIALLAAASIANAQEKAPLRGLVSMGAYKFVVRAEDPDNTLAPLNAKPGIFGGIVILASWRELRPSANSPLPENNAIDKALREARIQPQESAEAVRRKAACVGRIRRA